MNRTRYTWIKLYTEILDDPKMGKMDDGLWRKTVELFLLAGRNGMNGVLPSIDAIAWSLRTPQEEINKTLKALQALKIVNRLEDGNWLVTHFTVRQSALSAAERQRRHREVRHSLSQTVEKT